jgi:hypothetical protein
MGGQSSIYESRAGRFPTASQSLAAFVTANFVWAILQSGAAPNFAQTVSQPSLLLDLIDL